MSPRHLATLTLSMCILTAGCVSETAIYTRPGGADVVLLNRGRALGKTPILLRDQLWVFTRHDLEFTKKGYLPAQISLEPNARPLNITFCAICSVATWPVWPMVLLADFERPKYVVTMQPNPSSFESAAPALSPAPRVTFAAAP